MEKHQQAPICHSSYDCNNDCFGSTRSTEVGLKYSWSEHIYPKKQQHFNLTVTKLPL